jgi:hypothetical protein
MSTLALNETVGGACTATWPFELLPTDTIKVIVIVMSLPRIIRSPLSKVAAICLSDEVTEVIGIDLAVDERPTYGKSCRNYSTTRAGSIR